MKARTRKQAFALVSDILANFRSDGPNFLPQSRPPIHQCNYVLQIMARKKIPFSAAIKRFEHSCHKIRRCNDANCPPGWELYLGSCFHCQPIPAIGKSEKAFL